MGTLDPREPNQVQGAACPQMGEGPPRIPLHLFLPDTGLASVVIRVLESKREMRSHVLRLLRLLFPTCSPRNPFPINVTKRASVPRPVHQKSAGPTVQLELCY